MEKALEVTVEEPLESREDSIEDILKRIAEFKKRTAKVSATVEAKPNNIYFYELRLPDHEHITYKRFHGKCFKKGIQPFLDAGYTYLSTGHRDVDDYLGSRTTCEHCNAELHPANAKKLRAEKKAKMEQLVIDRERRLKRELAKQKELVLLGKL